MSVITLENSLGKHEKNLTESFFLATFNALKSGVFTSHTLTRLSQSGFNFSAPPSRRPRALAATLFEAETFCASVKIILVHATFAEKLFVDLLFFVNRPPYARGTWW